MDSLRSADRSVWNCIESIGLSTLRTYGTRVLITKRVSRSYRDSSGLIEEAANLRNYIACEIEEWKNGVRLWSNGEMTLTGKTEELRA